MLPFPFSGQSMWAVLFLFGGTQWKNKKSKSLRSCQWSCQRKSSWTTLLKPCKRITSIKVCIKICFLKRSLNTLLIIAHIFFDFHRQLFRSLFQQIGTFTLHFILQLACKLLNVLFFIFDTLGFDSSCNLINGQHRCAILCAFKGKNL